MVLMQTGRMSSRESFDSLNSSVQKCFEAYGVDTYVEMLGTSEAPGPWYPMYSFSNAMTTSTPGGVAWTKMGEIKHEYLPRVVMSDDFESEWDTYMEVYDGCNPQVFLEEMQEELNRRMEEASKFEQKLIYKTGGYATGLSACLKNEVNVWLLE